MAKLEEFQIKQIVQLSHGKGRLSPSGKQHWTYRELAKAYKVSPSTISATLKKLDMVPDKAIDIQAIRESESTELTAVMGKLREAINNKDLDKASVYELSTAYKNLAGERRKNEEFEMKSDITKMALQALDKQSTQIMHEAQQKENAIDVPSETKKEDKK